MYITKVVLENICCFEKLTLEFNNDSSGSWIVFLGDNGVGKTTLLRCIAMGLCNETSASALLRELYGDLIRYQSKDKTGTIYIELKSNKKNTVWIKTVIEQTKSGNIEVNQKTSPSKDNFPWNDIFACGYGAMRGVYATQDIVEYSSVDSVYTLFNYNAPLQSSELVLRRLGYSNPEKIKPLLEAIDHILMLPKGSTQLGEFGIVVKGKWLEEVSYGGWGDGHRATLTWLCDLFGWISLYDKDMLQKGPTGIVLIDEIEQHLHPNWQRRIIGRLNESFPNIQFIVSTHSPLSIIGATDLPDGICSLVHLRRDGDAIEGSITKDIPRGYRADQVLTSYLFGMATSSDDKTKYQVERYSELAGKNRTSMENEEFEILSNELDSKIGSSETKLEDIVSREVHAALTKSRDAIVFDPKTLNYEIHRQLKKLLSSGDSR